MCSVQGGSIDVEWWVEVDRISAEQLWREFKVSWCAHVNLSWCLYTSCLVKKAQQYFVQQYFSSHNVNNKLFGNIKP